MIYEKLARIQRQLQVGKDNRNDFGNYNYRTGSAILSALKPLLEKERCMLYLSDNLTSMNDEVYVVGTVTLIDLEDEGKIIVTAYARESKTQKGMVAPQMSGSSSTYARKYALCGMFAIDDDTQDPDSKDNREVKQNLPPFPQGEVLKVDEQGVRLLKQFEQMGKDLQAALKWAGVKKVEALPNDTANKIIAKWQKEERQKDE